MSASFNNGTTTRGSTTPRSMIAAALPCLINGTAHSTMLEGVQSRSIAFLPLSSSSNTIPKLYTSSLMSRITSPSFLKSPKSEILAHQSASSRILELLTSRCAIGGLTSV
ncbi:hypothetical protein HanRHA438_Chr13g0595211 [Helianthus annuus]|nr:hypothetical protein HanRHA438_Chr13g0595211 [Helianthus annuus]